MIATPYQEALAGATTPYVVARWGRRTGKDATILSILDEDDLFVFPTHMRMHYHREYRFIKNIVSEQELPDRLYSSGRVKRVFIMEAAFMDKQYRILERCEDMNVEQIFIVSTPHLQSKITSSGFLFDAICARLNMCLVSDYSYSQVGYSDAPFSDPNLSKDIKKSMPLKYVEEMDADYIGKKPNTNITVRIDISNETNND